MSRSSELQDALNPNFFTQQYQSQSNVSPVYDRHERPSLDVPQAPTTRQFTPYRNELEDAINHATISPGTAARNVLEKQSVFTRRFSFPRIQSNL